MFANWSPPCRVLVEHVSEWFSIFFLLYRRGRRNAKRPRLAKRDLRKTHGFTNSYSKRTRLKYFYFFFVWVLGLNSTFSIIQQGWEPNQKPTIQKLAHGMKSNRNSSFSRKDSLNMQFATIWENFYYFFFFFLFFFLIVFMFPYYFFYFFLHFFVIFLFFSYVLLLAIALYFVTYDIRFIIFYSRRLLCFLFVFIIISFLTPLIRCPLIGLPILT